MVVAADQTVLGTLEIFEPMLVEVVLVSMMKMLVLGLIVVQVGTVVAVIEAGQQLKPT